MEINDIFQIIDDFDNATFEQCKNHLYRNIDFHIISESEVRRVDLKEKLATIIKQYPYIPRKNYEISFVEYAEGILSHYVSISKRDIRDYNYEMQRQQLAESLSKGGTSLSALEDYFLVFLSVCRELTSIGDYEKKAQVRNVTYYLTPEDVESIEKIWHNAVKYDSTERKVILKIKEKTSTKTHEFKSNERLFLYILSVLLLFRILQFEGEIR